MPTIYIDKASNHRFEKVTPHRRTISYFFNKAQHWSKRAVERLQDPYDTDFARVFNVIFMTPKDNMTKYHRSALWQIQNGHQEHEKLTTSEHVVSALSHFANNWSISYDKDVADLRFYSGGRARFNGDPNPANKYYDYENHLYYTDVCDWKVMDEERTLRYNGTPGTAELPHVDLETMESARKQNRNRHVIDIGTEVLREIIDWDDEGLGASANFQNTALDRIISTYFTRRILCEMLKLPPYLLEDTTSSFCPDVSTFDWSVAMQCKKGETHCNAESIALLVLWAALADTVPSSLAVGGYSLDRQWYYITGSREDMRRRREDRAASTAEPELKWEKNLTYDVPWNINPVIVGIMVPYADITGPRQMRRGEIPQ